MKLFFTFVAIARNRVPTRLRLWVILTLSVAIYSVSADTIVLKSGETLKGQITSESDLRVTISTETSTGKTDKTIAKSEIVGMTLSSPPAAPTPSSVSPDKQWEYKRSEIVNASTAQVVLDLGQEVDLEGSEPEILWAPDSKRFGFTYSPVHAHHTTYDKVAFFQLRGDKWVALHQPSNALHPSQLLQPPLKDHLPKGFNARHCAPEWDEVKLRKWTDANTAILYAPCYGRSRDLNAAFLFTLKFDEAGNWKIIKTHQMSKKELEEE
jgi:hypothetical protein